MSSSAGIISSALKLNPEGKAFEIGVNVAWFLSIIAIVIAIILIIVSITRFYAGDKAGGWTSLVFGGIFGIGGILTFRYTKDGVEGIARRNIERIKQNIQRIKAKLPNYLIKGKGEDDFEGDTVRDIWEDDCGCNGGIDNGIEDGTDGGKYDEYDEAEFVNSSEDEDEEPGSFGKKHKKTAKELREKNKKIKKSKKSSKRVKFQGSGDDLITVLKEVILTIGDENLSDLMKNNLETDEDVLKVLDELLKNPESLKKSYEKLSSEKKKEIADILDKLILDDEALKAKFEKFKTLLLPS